MKIRSLLVVVSLFLSVLAAFAQTDRGTITGTVSDTTGAVIPGVSIEAKNVQTGATYQAGSSETLTLRLFRCFATFAAPRN